MILHLPSYHFPIKVPSNFQAFSITPSWTSFFRLLMLPGAKMLDFGIPLAPSGVQNGAQNHPSGDHMMTKCNPRSSDGAPKYCSWNRLDPKVAFGALLGIILVDMGWIFDDFWMILASVWLNFRQFWRQLCRPLKPHATYRKTENHQEQTDNCRNSTNKQRTSDNEYNMLCLCWFRI